MASIFSRIIQGEIPSYKIAESDHYFAFLDINPLARGHALVIPKQETDYIFDLDEETYSGLFTFSRKVGKAIEEVIPCKRIGIIVFGLDVPHAHVHLIPINKSSEMSFSSPRVELTPEEFAEIAEKIQQAYLDQ
ncbi:MAG: HIT family protein [bacterium]|jgi:histidine triad (HIT) family protein